MADLNTVSNLVNFGAFFGFAALNLSVIWLYYVKKKGEAPEKQGGTSGWKPTGFRHIRYLLLPFAGFAVIVYVWSSMNRLALIIGSIWLTIGFIYLMTKTKGFRKLPPHLDIS